ncbi:MAG: peptidoglycan-binding protein [Dorea longicatena]|nr:peptidoglycan-binding protein [Dorea longicatena]
MGWIEYEKKLKEWYGYSEAKNQDDIIIDIYNSQRPSGSYKITHTDPWCHATVSAAAYASGNAGEVPNTCYCQTGINIWKQWGKWIGRYTNAYNPQVGYIIYYDWNKDLISDHVGTIIARNGDTLTVREGNRNDMLCDRQINVNSPLIIGYGIPDWGGATQTPVATIPSHEETKRTWLQIGDTGAEVKDVQTKLIALGYSLPSGADGEYGSETFEATKQFQHDVGIKEDGLAGEITRSKLNNAYNTRSAAKANNSWVARLQAACNAQGFSNQKVDGIAGPNTLAGCPTLGTASRGSITKLVQEKLNASGYNCGAVDGKNGPNTQKGINAFKKAKGLTANGIVDKSMWKALLGL